MEILNLDVLDTVHHLKRGSTYQIIARALWSRVVNDGDMTSLIFYDGGMTVLTEEVRLGQRMSVCIPNIQFQRSLNEAPLGISAGHAFVYRSERQPELIFARPTYEFTTDRFEKMP